jgi:hypothetical protein
MQGLISPDQPINEAVGLFFPHIDTDFQPTASAFRTDEPLKGTMFADTFFNPFRMHPSATATR